MSNIHEPPGSEAPHLTNVADTTPSRHIISKLNTNINNPSTQQLPEGTTTPSSDKPDACDLVYLISATGGSYPIPKGYCKYLGTVNDLFEIYDEKGIREIPIPGIDDVCLGIIVEFTKKYAVDPVMIQNALDKEWVWAFMSEFGNNVDILREILCWTHYIHYDEFCEIIATYAALLIETEIGTDICQLFGYSPNYTPEEQEMVDHEVETHRENFSMAVCVDGPN